MTLDAQTVEALADEIVRRQARMACPVLNVDEAMAMVGKRSSSSFNEWCKKFKVKGCGQGRYARQALQAGLNREARGRVKKAQPSTRF